MNIVYQITNRINGKHYFGITKQNLSTRWIQHKCNSIRKNLHLYKAILKYGFDNFDIRIVKECDTESEMYNFEKELIKKHDTTNPQKGYNNSTGGEVSSKGTKRTNEQKKKMSTYQKTRKRKPHSLETINKMKAKAAGRDIAKVQKISADKRRGNPARNIMPIFSIDKDGTKNNYNSLTEASYKTEILITSICNNLKNKSKIAGGLTWNYQQQN